MFRCISNHGYSRFVNFSGKDALRTRELTRKVERTFSEVISENIKDLQRAYRNDFKLFSIFSLGNSKWKNKRLPRFKRHRLKLIIRKKDKVALANEYREERKRLTGDSMNNIETNEIISTNVAKWSSIANSNVQSDESGAGFSGFSYSAAEIRNTFMMISTQLLNSVIVEINLRNIMSPHSVKNIDSFFFLKRVTDVTDPMMLEVFQNMKDLTKSHETDSKVSEDDSRVDKSTTFSRFLQDIKASNSFNSLQMYRYYFNYFKTSQHLNYDEADTFKFVKSWYPIKFRNPEVNNTQYILGFDKCIQIYEPYDELSHLKVALSISQLLLRDSDYIPDVKFFKYMIDALGKIGLRNYESIIFHGIQSPKYIRSLLGNHEGKAVLTPTSPAHLQDFIELEPGFLETFIKYQVYREDKGALVRLLSFFKLREVHDHAKILNKSNLASLVSKSRFSRGPNDDFLEIVFKSEKEIFIPIESVYSAIKGCILLKAYEYIDLLVNKLLVSTVALRDSNCIALSLGNDPSKYSSNEAPCLLISKNSTADFLSSVIFTKELFKLLLRASRVSDDTGRFMWFAPHLDAYLSRVVESSKPHIDLIKRQVSGEQDIDMGQFQKLENESMIDTELIQEIYEASYFLGLDGKLAAYDHLLDFKNTYKKLIKIPQLSSKDQGMNTLLESGLYFTGNS